MTVAFLFPGTAQTCSGLEIQKNTSSSHLWPTWAQDAPFSNAGGTDKGLGETKVHDNLLKYDSKKYFILKYYLKR